MGDRSQAGGSSVVKRTVLCLIAGVALAGCSAERAAGGAGAPDGGNAGAGSAHDPLGTVQAAAATCPPGGLTGICQALTVSCPGIADFTGTIKVVSPAAAPAGTVIFQNGGGGVGWYESSFAHGMDLANTVLQAGYTIVDLSWAPPQGPAQGGWLTGPGGPRKLACRYATAARWIRDHVHQGGTQSPFCATGNSGGSAAIAYALALYDMGSIFDMVEPTSGPPMGRIDHGCICDQPPAPVACGAPQAECYFGAGAILDMAYGNDWCSTAVSSHDSTHASAFWSDSVAAPDAVYAYPSTDVHVLFGGADTAGGAAPLGFAWASRITTLHTIDCVPNAAHPMADSVDGATRIANDLVTYCKKR